MSTPRIIAAYAGEIDTLLVSILSVDQDASEAIGNALDAAIRIPGSPGVQPGETLLFNGTILVAMESESAQAAAFIRTVASKALGRDIPSSARVTVIDRAEDLLRSGLMDPEDLPAPDDVTWLLDGA